MNQSKIVLFGLVLLVAATFVLAQKPAEGNTTTAQDAKNMTFGQCVSDAADAKNTCYETVKTTYETCKTEAQNATDQEASKSCGASYKKDKNQCKAGFKAAKNECGKIKHSAWEGFKAKFK